uniref:Uncharacterized protein n=1 Tax=Siphoviridae sp. ctZHD14 TaxID=2827891 RepID=A0A8S5SW64_9CAUD|nr:MAG TPA: hypothetical protein [Siphoviridae sp. ctZHD14]
MGNPGGNYFRQFFRTFVVKFIIKQVDGGFLTSMIQIEGHRFESYPLSWYGDW